MKQLTETSKKIIQQQSKIFIQIAALIHTSKEILNRSFNKELTMLNWQIGKHIDETIANS